MKNQSKYQLLYYFVNEQWVLDDLQKQRIKISRFDDVNDPYELRGSRLKNFPDLEKSFRSVCYETMGLLCFSKNFRSPIMWSHYANKHKGACFGFDLSKTIQLHTVQYISKPEEITFSDDLLLELETHRGQAPPKQVLMQADHFTRRAFTRKHEAWAYEQEVRAFVNATEPENGMYFKSICKEGVFLREVILGARNTLDPALVRSALKGFGHQVSLLRAHLSETAYEIILQPEG